MPLKEGNLSLHQTILNSLNYPVISITEIGIINAFNQAAEKITGYTAAEIINNVSLEFLIDEAPKPTQGAVPVNTLANHSTEFNGLLSQIHNIRDSKKFALMMKKKDGECIPVELLIKPLLEGDRRIGYACVVNETVGETIAPISASEYELTRINAALSDIIFELDEKGRFIKVWVESDDHLFLPREKIIGYTLDEMFGEDYAKPFNDALHELVKTGKAQQLEYTSRTPYDSQWFSSKYSLIYENGLPTKRVSVCIQNITERKEMEMTLRASEEKFRLLAEHFPGVVFLMKQDKKDSIVYINEKVDCLTGYTAQEFLTQKIHLSDLFHPEDTAYIDNVKQRAIEDEIGYQLEYRLKTKLDKWLWVCENGMAVYADREPQYLEAFIIDITARKESEEQIRRMSDENTRIFNNSLSLTAMISFDGYFKKLNPAWEKTFGWSTQELMRVQSDTYIHPDDLQKTKEVFGQILSGKTVESFENRYRCKDGTYRWLLWASLPDMRRKVIYASAIDITGRKRSEEEVIFSKRNVEIAALELQEQNRQLDEFAHIISHNLRAPLNNIKALLGFITHTSRIDDYQLIFEKIKNVTHNISDTMNDLMETIKIKNNTELERVELRFKDVLDKVIQSIEGDLVESGATITYNFNNAPKIYYSKPYLESILQNLITNAIKYRSPNRIAEIYLSTDIIKTGIELRVRDNGLGIDLEKHGNKLFGLHKTFHENTEARGVGLFLTKTQIETLGGSITAESEVDKGTTFTIQF